MAKDWPKNDFQNTMHNHVCVSQPCIGIGNPKNKRYMPMNYYVYTRTPIFWKLDLFKNEHTTRMYNHSYL